MFLTKLFQFFRGYLVITVTGQYPERFFNVCANRRVIIWDLFPCSKTVMRCCISNRGFRMLPEIVKKTGVTVKIIEKHGLPVMLQRIKKRKGFVVGIGIFFLLLIIINQFIWKIEIVGCETVSKLAVERKLAECGLKIGAFRPFLDEKSLQNQMLIQMPELSWLWADKSGSKVVVQVKERVPVPDIFDPNAFCNIIAKKDGVIDSMIVKSGVPMVALGDTVLKGDILVSGLIVSDKGVEPRQVQSEAEIMARVWYEKTKAFSLWDTKKKASGEKETKYVLHLFGWDVNLFFRKESKFSNFSEETKDYELSLFGNYLGLGITKQTFHEEETVYEKMTVESVVENGIQEIEKEIDEQTVPNSEKKESQVSHQIIDDDTVEVTVVAEYLEDIAEKVSVG